MISDIQTIRYSYSSDSVSRKAVDHAFRYISAISGLKFRPDSISPVIYRGAAQPPSTVKLILRSEIEGDDRIDGERTICKDFVKRIANLLSVKVHLGPHGNADSEAAASPDALMSRHIVDFVGSIARAGVISSDHRGVTLWPDGGKFGAAFTHDVDIARRSVAGGMRLLFNKGARGSIRGIADTVSSAIGRRPNPYDMIPLWLEKEKDLGILSTFFVFAGARRHGNDPKYKLGRLNKSLSAIKKRGCETALHTTIESYDGKYIGEAKSSLEDHCGGEIHGARPHYLSADLPAYWRAVADSGLIYSSCLGFDDRAGHFDGIDLPFVPFDHENDCPINSVEIPLSIMDCGLTGSQEADSEEVFNKGREIVDRAAESGGLVVLDWHQRTLYEPDYPGWGDLFIRLAQYIIEKGAYTDTMAGIAGILNSRMREFA